MSEESDVGKEAAKDIFKLQSKKWGPIVTKEVDLQLLNMIKQLEFKKEEDYQQQRKS